MKTNRFTIIAYENEYELQHAPEGWDSRNRSLTRSDSAHGVFRTFTSDLIFYKDGFDLLYNLWDQYGVNCLAELKTEKYNAKTGAYILESQLKFDFTTYSQTFE